MPPEVDVPRVSAIMPVYNAGPVLRPAVLSVIQQDFSDWELVLIDDGSTDGCLDQIRDIRDPRLRIIRHGTNRGLAATLNEAIESARGAYLARVDQDDLLFPGRFARQVAFLEQHPEVDLVASRMLVFSGTDMQLLGIMPGKSDADRIGNTPWIGVPLPHPSWMGRAAWFRRWRYTMPELLRVEDQELLLRALNNSTYHLLPDLLVAYRQFPPRYSKILVTRWSVVNMQVQFFLRHRQYRHAMLSVLAWMARMVRDVYGALGNRRYYVRLASQEIPTQVKEGFAALVASTQA